tara:strand:+ start:1695 stop:2177 length:483 start_codon:yes stop_codon:yes gene_type:complete
MANNQPFSSVPVIPSDTLNIPQPGIITSGLNATVGTTLTDPGNNFLNSVTNLNGYNISGGDVVYAGGAIDEILAVATATTLTMQTSTAATTYDIYKGNVGGDTAFTLFVGTGGAASTLKVRTANGEDVTLNNVPDSSFIPLQVIRVFATGTTCSNILALN